MVLRRRKRGDDDNVNVKPESSSSSSYEQIRQFRIKENKGRLQKLGILDLKSRTCPTPKTSANAKLPKSHLALSIIPRRSSRLRTVNPVDYSVSDFYTTIYCPEKGETCHQFSLVVVSDENGPGMTNPTMVLGPRKRADEEKVTRDGSTYEELRERRIKENNERMQKLGIFNLSLKPKSLTAPPTRKSSQSVKLPKSPLPLSTSLRRSSRIKAKNDERMQTLGILDLPLNLKCLPAPTIIRYPNVKLPKSLPLSTSLSSSHHEQQKKPEETSSYEQLRQQRIKENNERMQKLGILELSLTLKSSTAPTPKSSPNPKLPKPLSASPRRSSRLRSVNPVDYSVSNFHTTIYDPEKDQSCHQYKHKTLRLHTHCSGCRAQFCERCLYTRYGENAVEVNKNSYWVCPVCRGICNCYCCRKAKGLAPIGPIYRKVSKLGFKSVAHYLVHTEQLTTQPEDTGVEILETDKRELSFSNKAQMEEEEKQVCPLLCYGAR
ncbi:Zinc-finger domain of monoamine-oxidase A repressor R1 [Euphorbia peplus]|nr:Zinc-finger domain of monoamine-oxidase A repressor R1 [Euphorbia peplus]